MSEIERKRTPRDDGELHFSDPDGFEWYSRSAAIEICQLAFRNGRYIALIEGFVARETSFESRVDVSWVYTEAEEKVTEEEIMRANNNALEFIEACDDEIDAFMVHTAPVSRVRDTQRIRKMYTMRR